MCRCENSRWSIVWTSPNGKSHRQPSPQSNSRRLTACPLSTRTSRALSRPAPPNTWKERLMGTPCRDSYVNPLPIAPAVPAERAQPGRINIVKGTGDAGPGQDADAALFGLVTGLAQLHAGQVVHLRGAELPLHPAPRPLVVAEERERGLDRPDDVQD